MLRAPPAYSPSQGLPRWSHLPWMKTGKQGDNPAGRETGNRFVMLLCRISNDEYPRASWSSRKKEETSLFGLISRAVLHRFNGQNLVEYSTTFLKVPQRYLRHRHTLLIKDTDKPRIPQPDETGKGGRISVAKNTDTPKERIFHGSLMISVNVSPRFSCQSAVDLFRRSRPVTPVC